MKFDKYGWHKQVMQDRTITPSERMALFAVFDFSHGDGTGAFASVPRIVKWTGLSKATVDRALETGRRRGWIAQTERGGRAKDGKGRASVYRLTFPNSTPHARDVEEDDSTPQEDDSTPHSSAFNASFDANQRLTGEAPTDPVTTDPGSSDPSASKLNQVASPSHVSSDKDPWANLKDDDECPF
jgi:hypothetical protein